MINSTSSGGGVAEILRNLVPLLNDTGPNVGWRTVPGHRDFFRVTKRIHNALQGENIDLTEEKKNVYEGVNEDFSKFTHVDHDLVTVHDPQPLPLIENYKLNQPWVWRCHIDLSDPNEEIWEYLQRFIIPYDHEVYQHEEFALGPGDHSVIYPSIDPLSTKNTEIDEETERKYLEKIGIDPDDSRPLILQVSRFDPWKDPMGVIDVFNKVKEEKDARLLLVGAIVEDDPQAEGIYEEVRDKTKDREDITLAPNIHDIAVNAAQRAADIVLQKSLREGFGLTVAEAMWKKTPVIGSNTGGIPEQVEDGETGHLVDPENHQEVADRVLGLLSLDEDRRKEMGEKAKERIRKDFLITRQVEDWLDLCSKMIG
ncbi:MAG: glycosyltransferase [Candidatus Aenigmatarchaeota archaeon]